MTAILKQSPKKEIMLETGIVEYLKPFRIASDFECEIIQIDVEPEVSHYKKTIIFPKPTAMLPKNKVNVLYKETDAVRDATDITELGFYRKLPAYMLKPRKFGSLERTRESLETDLKIFRADYYSIFPSVTVEHIVAGEKIKYINGLGIDYEILSR